MCTSTRRQKERETCAVCLTQSMVAEFRNLIQYKLSGILRFNSLLKNMHTKSKHESLLDFSGPMNPCVRNTPYYRQHVAKFDRILQMIFQCSYYYQIAIMLRDNLITKNGKLCAHVGLTFFVCSSFYSSSGGFFLYGFGFNKYALNTNAPRMRIKFG